MPAIQFAVNPAHAPAAPERAITRGLWQLLALGLLLVLLFPAARGHSLLLGSGPLWLLGAPLASLLALHRNAVAAAWRGVLVPATRRRRPMRRSRRLR